MVPKLLQSEQIRPSTAGPVAEGENWGHGEHRLYLEDGDALWQKDDEGDFVYVDDDEWEKEVRNSPTIRVVKVQIDCRTAFTSELNAVWDNAVAAASSLRLEQLRDKNATIPDSTWDQALAFARSDASDES